jgi:2,5-diketo-D-gluconate reductase A
MNLRDNSLNLPLKMENNQCTVSMIHYTRQRYKRIERSKIMEYTTLSNGLKMPLLGFGVFQVPEADVCEKAVTDAIASGYRLIDTAAAYMNEEAVGAAIAKCGVPREELFITTKLWVQDASYEGAKAAVERSLKKLGTDYLDLYLIHQPMGDYYGAYRAMEEMYKEGKLKAIGVCNFYPHILADFCETVDIKPMVNQVELHPFFQQENALSVMKEYGVVPEAWGPFAEGNHGIFTHPVLAAIGEKYGKTPAQVALRWNVQRGVVVIPKSVHKERMEQNMDVWDFEISDEDMKEIAKLDLGHSEIVDHSNPEFVKMLHGLKVHD